MGRRDALNIENYGRRILVAGCLIVAARRQNSLIGVATADFYDRVWTKFGPELDYTEIARIDFITRSIRGISSSRTLRILDLGCGRGWMAPFLSTFGRVTGVDFSQTGIAFAAEHYGAHGTFYLADAESSTLGLAAEAPFDVVVCSEVLEHTLDHADLIRQIAQFLRRGGWCVLTTPNGNVWPQFRVDPRFKAGLQPIENWVSPRRLRELLGAAGFRVTRHEGRPVYGFHVGVTGFLQRRRIERALVGCGLGPLYYRAIVPTAPYQCVAACKSR
jgi:SAM-dependent methyltransferase